MNYGHIGAVIGHELTHGFDDEGKKFDAQGQPERLVDAEDTKKFEARTDCLVNEYGGFTAVDDVKVNGKLTLGENTADNGGLVLAYMAYLERAKERRRRRQCEGGWIHRPAAVLHRVCAELVRELAAGGHADPGADGPALAGPLPCEWRDRRISQASRRRSAARRARRWCR